MAEKDFVVKNGIVVNGAITVNSTGFFNNVTPIANSTYFFGKSNTAATADNSANLGGVAAASYVNTSGNYTISGNINFTGANVHYSTGLKIGANIVATTTSINFGNATVNSTINSTGFFVNGALATGGGYYKGNDGAIGNTNNKGNLFRINSSTQTSNITIETGEQALTVGPLIVAEGYNLTVQEGGRAVVI